MIFWGKTLSLQLQGECRSFAQDVGRPSGKLLETVGGALTELSPDGPIQAQILGQVYTLNPGRQPMAEVVAGTYHDQVPLGCVFEVSDARAVSTRRCPLQGLYQLNRIHDVSVVTAPVDPTHRLSSVSEAGYANTIYHTTQFLARDVDSFRISHWLAPTPSSKCNAQVFADI